jgi:hypothetical protein
MLSPCCHAPCYIECGRPDFVGDRTGITQHYACSACGEACDPITDIPDPNG